MSLVIGFGMWHLLLSDQPGACPPTLAMDGATCKGLSQGLGATAVGSPWPWDLMAGRAAPAPLCPRPCPCMKPVRDLSCGEELKNRTSVLCPSQATPSTLHPLPSSLSSSHCQTARTALSLWALLPGEEPQRPHSHVGLPDALGTPRSQRAGQRRPGWPGCTVLCSCLLQGPSVALQWPWGRGQLVLALQR